MTAFAPPPQSDPFGGCVMQTHSARGLFSDNSNLTSMGTDNKHQLQSHVFMYILPRKCEPE